MNGRGRRRSRSSRTKPRLPWRRDVAASRVVTRNTLHHLLFSYSSWGDTQGAKEEYKLSHQSGIGASQSRARDSERLLSYRNKQQAESFQTQLEFCPDSVTSLPVTLISSPPFYVFSVFTHEL